MRVRVCLPGASLPSLGNFRCRLQRTHGSVMGCCCCCYCCYGYCYSCFSIMWVLPIDFLRSGEVDLFFWGFFSALIIPPPFGPFVSPLLCVCVYECACVCVRES